MKYLLLLNILLITLVFVESALFFLIGLLKKDFQWLITSKDRVPKIDSDGLKRFLKHGFDPHLGWVRKPNTSGKESIKSVGEVGAKYNNKHYNINPKGARLNIGHEHLPPLISCYGDSFTFCRQANDNETWEWYLSELTGTNVINFGVGNYGIDQSLLRLKREYENNRTKFVMLCTVPESIIRCINIWKHYIEYGNTFGFKPRFTLSDNNLVFVKNFIDSESKFFNIEHYLKDIQKYDYCYAKKFQNDILQFPYSISVLKNWKRNIPLISSLILRKINNLFGINNNISNLPWRLILERNFKFCIELYKRPDVVNLFTKIIDEFVVFSKDSNIIPIFIFLPYMHDVHYSKDQYCYYEDFISEISKKVFTIDLTNRFLHMDSIDHFYVNSFYGGHLNEKGNEFVATVISEEMTQRGLL